jgi:hypothetical protein
VAAAGNSSSILNYSYADNDFNSATGLCYYRLKIVDKDNEITYSELRAVSFRDEDFKAFFLIRSSKVICLK